MSLCLFLQGAVSGGHRSLVVPLWWGTVWGPGHKGSSASGTGVLLRAGLTTAAPLARPGKGGLAGEMVSASMALPPSCLTRPCPCGSSSLVLGLAARLKLLHPLFISFCCHCCLAEAGLFTASLCCCRVGSIRHVSQGFLGWVWGSGEVQCVSAKPWVCCFMLGLRLRGWSNPVGLRYHRALGRAVVGLPAMAQQSRCP